MPGWAGGITSTYFGQVIPLALRVMTHPSFDRAALARARPTGADVIRAGLAARLESLARRRRIAPGSEPAAARLLVSLAHDWALGASRTAGADPPAPEARLLELVDLVWQGLRPRRRA